PGAPAPGLVEPERRYALDALLDALGLRFDESAPAEADELDEVFGLLTLPPARPPGPRVAELAAVLAKRLGVERRGYPGGERFLVALTHDVDLLGAGRGAGAAPRVGRRV